MQIVLEEKEIAQASTCLTFYAHINSSIR